MVGRHIRTHSGLIGAVFRTPGFKREEAGIAARSHELLDYVGIGKYADFKARLMSAALKVVEVHPCPANEVGQDLKDLFRGVEDEVKGAWWRRC